MLKELKHTVIDGKNVFLGGFSRIGNDKMVNQDAFRVGEKSEKGIAYIVIADGLGSCRNSEKGAKRIVDIIENWILNSLESYNCLTDNTVNNFTKYILTEWRNSYSKDEISFFDTTVCVTIYYKGNVLIGGIGDGMALIKCDEHVLKDCIERKEFFSNVTNSMCSLKNEDDMCFEIISTDSSYLRLASILATDGIADDLIQEKKLTLLDYFINVIENHGQEVLQEELQEWIEEWETEFHCDDKTMCYLIFLEGGNKCIAKQN